MTASLHAGSGETSPTRIAEIEARVNAASAGPWIGQNYVGAGVEVRGHMPRSEHAEYTLRESDTALLFSAPWHQFGAAKVLPQYLANAEFVANARQDIPWLLGELHFAQTFAPPNALGAHTMAALVEGAREYRDRLQVVESALRAASDREAALRAKIEALPRYEFDESEGIHVVCPGYGTLLDRAGVLSALSSDEQTNE